MLLEGTLYLALYCAYCGKFERLDISLFDIKKGEELVVKSTCSENYITLKTYNFKKFYFSVPCFSCGTRHVYKYRLSSLLNNRAKVFKCKLSKLNILCIGEKEYIDNIVKKSSEDLQELMRDSGFEDYIVNPHIMMEILNKIDYIAQKGNLSCDCGCKEIDINLFADRIELICMGCGSVSIIYAENNEDLKAIASKNRIVLRERSLTCLDSMYHSGRF